MNTSLLKEVTSCKHLRRSHLTWLSEDAMWLCFSNSLCCTRMHCDDAISMSPLPVTPYHHCKATTMMKQMALKAYWSCHPAGQRKHFLTLRLRVNLFSCLRKILVQFISCSLLYRWPWCLMSFWMGRQAWVLKKLPPLRRALVAKFRDGRNVMVKRGGVRERTHRCSIHQTQLRVQGRGPPETHRKRVCVSQ